MSHRRTALALAALMVPFVACTPADQEPAIVEVQDFASTFTLSDTVALEQSDSLPIVAVSGLDFGPNGIIAVTDFGEGNLKIFEPTGRLRRVIGRKGRGPGEFLLPASPRFDRSGRIHVLDLQNAQVMVFDSTGAFLRSVNIVRAGFVVDHEVLPDGSYLLATSSSEKHLLVRVDSAGERMASYVPRADYVPEGERTDAPWPNVRRAALNVQGEQAYAILSIADSLWTVDLTSGKTRSEHLSPPDYVRPSAPAQGTADDRSGVDHWADSFTQTLAVVGSGKTVVTTFGTGVSDPEAPKTVLHREAAGGWTAATGAPMFARARGDEFVAVSEPGGERVVLTFWRRNSP